MSNWSPKFFSGGRTRCFHLLAQWEGDQIQYLNVTWSTPIPTGKSRIYKNSFPSMEKVHDLVDCTVIPPLDLKIPVLPYIYGGWLTFCLCRKCMEDHKIKDCHHSKDHCQFRVTLCTRDPVICVLYSDAEYFFNFFSSDFDAFCWRWNLFNLFSSNFEFCYGIWISAQFLSFWSWVKISYFKPRFLSLYCDLTSPSFLLDLQTLINSKDTFRNIICYIK